MSQCSKYLSLNTILTNVNLQLHSNISQGKISSQKSLEIKEQLFYLQNFIADCENLNISQNEFAYLKLISLLDSGK